ncbi:hypothetical protein [Actinomadura rudentiformis]|uniref:Nuclear transport factor 2 family protein n=1 Tax=Actinomadura rudentiformis TaxID=359158 RepID=A0A6H9YCY1_9ACTN|nr:hypothetical protein [Actinomadura rudentiformis]KAB2341905.1 hypothetical protein F8566_40745 [Actinomadura rudentiformis]
MAYRSAVQLGALLFAGVFASAACGAADGTGDDKVFTAPSSKAPTSPAPAKPTPGTERTLAGARAALQAFLRGQGAGEMSVCRYVVPGSSFEKGGALRGNCLDGIRYSPHTLKPLEREALRSISVSGGKLVGNEATIPFSGLKWEVGDLVVSSVQSKFVLRWQDGIWKIIR